MKINLNPRILIATISLILQSFSGLAQFTCGIVEPTELEMSQKYYFGNNDTLPFVYEKSMKDLKHLFVLPDRYNGRQKSLTPCSDIDELIFIPIKFRFYYSSLANATLPSDLAFSGFMHKLNRLAKDAGLNCRFYALADRHIYISADKAVSSTRQGHKYMSASTQETFGISVHVIEDVISYGGFYNSYYDQITIEHKDFFRDPLGDSPNAVVLLHEIGHFLGLDHTFLNSSSSNYCAQEVVSRTEKYKVTDFCLRSGTICQSGGDALCDTEADFKDVSAHVSGTTCEYLGSAERDRYNQLYTPPTRNIMSYSLLECTTQFSNGQRAIMSGSINGYKNRITFVDNNHIDPDRFEPDNSVSSEKALLQLNQQQCRSMHTLDVFYTGEVDDHDWMEISAEPQIGTYSIVVDSYTGINNLRFPDRSTGEAN